jgi:hypothetical protein
MPSDELRVAVEWYADADESAEDLEGHSKLSSHPWM